MTPSSPTMMPACRAAPTATASSGLIPLNGAFPASFSIASWTAGILVLPPTRRILSMSPALTPASFMALRVGFIVLLIKSTVKSSNLALDRLMSKCSGCPSFMVINGRLICEELVPESSIFAFSAASLRRLMACRSFERSIPEDFLNSDTTHSTTLSSKSSPPSLLSPLVALTSI